MPLENISEPPAEEVKPQETNHNKTRRTGPSSMFPILMMCFMSAFLMTAIVVKSSSSRLRPTDVTSDDIRRLSINYNLLQLYNEFNELLNKLSLCERVQNQ